MFKIYSLKSVIICINIVSLQAYIFSYDYANDLLVVKEKIQHKFETLTNSSQYLYGHVNQYTNDLKRLLEVAHRYANMEEFVSNPIYAFQLVKLLTLDFDKLRDRFARKKALEFSSFIEETVKAQNLIFPSVHDLTGICQAILRLQDIYELDEEDILNGNFQNYWEGSLTESDLKELRVCYQYHKYLDVEKWLSSEIYSNEDTAEKLLLEYYKGSTQNFCTNDSADKKI